MHDNVVEVGVRVERFDLHLVEEVRRGRLGMIVVAVVVVVIAGAVSFSHCQFVAVARQQDGLCRARHEAVLDAARRKRRAARHLVSLLQLANVRSFLSHKAIEQSRVLNHRRFIY